MADSPEMGVPFILASLFIGVITRKSLANTRLPYTAVLLVIGMGLGGLEYGAGDAIGAFGQSLRQWSNVNSNVILYVLLPGLLFESSFFMDVHQVKKCLVQMFLLAGPGVIISTACIGLLQYFIFPYGWSVSTSLLLGSLLSATDPVAVIALMKDLGASKKLTTLIEGESTMNDGVAMVLFELFCRMVLGGGEFRAGNVLRFLLQVALGAVALGVAFGLFSTLVAKFSTNDGITEITFTLAVSYCTFFVAQHVAGVSGILSIMTAGIVFAAFSRAAFEGEAKGTMEHFWTMVSFVSNTITFILSGLIIAESYLRNQSHITGRDWGYLVLLYVFLLLARILAVTTLYPGLNYFGYGLKTKEGLVVIWSGLRGAVSLALALSIKENNGFSDEIHTKFVFFTGGMVVLTLIINGSTSQFLLNFLQIDQTTETEDILRKGLKSGLMRQALNKFEELDDNNELGPGQIDWTAIHKLTNDPQGELESLSTAESEAMNSQRLQEARTRFLNGVQATYWTMLGNKKISQTAATILLESVAEATDLVRKKCPLQDWTAGGLDYYTCLQRRTWWQRILLKKRLELACYISVAFLHAHNAARQQLREFMLTYAPGNEQIVEKVVQESESQTPKPWNVLQELERYLPDVLSKVKSRQVRHGVLHHFTEKIKCLEKSGMLREEDSKQICSSLQTTVYGEEMRLGVNAPLVASSSSIEYQVLASRL